MEIFITQLGQIWIHVKILETLFRSNVRPDIPYAGLFTQLGELHTIYHIWCYESMADRKACREATWHYPEWNDVVANTVPLVKTMKTRWENKLLVNNIMFKLYFLQDIGTT